MFSYLCNKLTFFDVLFRMKRKHIYNIIIKSSIILVFIAIIAWGYMQLNTREKSMDINLYTLVPQNCHAIVEANDVESWIHHTQSAQFGDAFRELTSSPILNKVISYFENHPQSRIHNPQSRINHLIISFHQQGNSYEPILYGSLPSDDLTPFNDIFRQEQPFLSPKEIKYKTESITILPLERDFIACYFQPGFFIVSQQIKLIEQAIDSYKENKSLINNPLFKSMLQKRQAGTHSLTLFIQNQPLDSIRDDSPIPLAHWQRYNIRINNESIYLTGECFGLDERKSISALVKNEQKSNLIPANDLPQQVRQFYQMPFHTDMTFTQSVDKDSSSLYGNNNLKDLLLLYSSRQLEVIDFYPKNSIKYETIIRIPLVDDISEVETFLRNTRLAQRKPSIWTQRKGYPVWMIDSSNLLYPHLKSATDNKYFLTISDKQFIFGTEINSIKDYLLETTDTLANPSELQPYYNHESYKYCLNDLAEEANFTFVTDLNLLLNNATKSIEEKDSIFLPPFILNQADFFKNFMLSIQLIHTQNETSTNIIFNYKGIK